MASKPMVLLGMSGGVDSSVAAALLLEQGYQVTGAIMKIWDGPEDSPPPIRHACFGPGEAEDIADAKATADKLGIPLLVLDLIAEYRQIVLEYFRREYAAGRTPNPCVRCNHRLKFGLLPQKARQQGIDFDYFATGHYARIEYVRSDQQYILKKGVDPQKDQSYFLYFLTQPDMKRLIFPLGNLTKAAVREIARKYLLPAAEKPESQDFAACGHEKLLEDEAKPGPVITADGKILGQHRGIVFYTVGQRRGLGIANEKPLYVIAKDREKNAILVGDKNDLFKSIFQARDINWISGNPPTDPIQAKARIRSTATETPAYVTPLPDSRVGVTFNEPQAAISPGQSVVFYDREVVLGGGIIDRVEGEHHG